MAYIGAEPDGMGKAQRFTFTASGSGTDVTADDDGIPIGYTAGQVSVYLNGVKQVIGSGKDVTATDGSTITFLAAYAADDVIEVVALSIFSATTVEGTDIISTGVTGTSKYLRVDGDGTSSWQTAGSTNASDLDSGILLDARMPNLTGDVTTVEGAVATTIANDAVTGAKIENNPTIAGNLTVSGDIVPSTPLSHRNMIINGAMSVAQRSVSTSTRNAYALCDRFTCNDSGMDNMSVLLTRNPTTDYEDCAGIRNSFKVNIAGAESAQADDESMYLEYRVEAQDLAHLKYGTSSAESVTLSFYVRSNENGVYALSVQSHDADKNIGTTYTVSNTDWQRVEWTIPGLTASGINNDNGIGFMIKWFLAAGDDLKDTSNTSWDTNAGGRYAYGQTAVLNDAVNNYWEITGVQLELGSNATPFEHRGYGEELARCQRYCIGIKTQGTTGGIQVGQGQLYSTSFMQGPMMLPAPMRVPPSIVSSGDGTFQAYSGSAGDTCGPVTVDGPGQNTDTTTISFSLSNLSIGAVGQAVVFRTNGDSSYMWLDSEL